MCNINVALLLHIILQHRVKVNKNDAKHYPSEGTEGRIFDSTQTSVLNINLMFSQNI